MEMMMPEWLYVVGLALALPFVVCGLFAAGMLFFVYAIWVVGLFSKLVHWAIPALDG